MSKKTALPFSANDLTKQIQNIKIKASMKDGVLALKVPRMKPVKPDVKKIEIK